MDAKDLDLDRRDFIRTLVVGAAAGALTLDAAVADAASCPKLPKAKTSKDVVPIRIQSELGDVFDGALDLTTVVRTSGEPYRVQFELFFDRYEEGRSVREITDKIETFALVDADLHRPPRVLFSWGKSSSFEGTFEGARAGFSLFLADGTPVRAIVLSQVITATDCVFQVP